MPPSSRLSQSAASLATAPQPAGGERWIETFRIESLNALVPLLGKTLQRAAKALAQRDEATSLATDLSVLRSNLIAYETRWQRELDEAFVDWPRPVDPQAPGLSLLSNDDLNSQLIGEPTIEALERRFEDVLDHVSSRLHTLSSALGHGARPINPVAPRQLVNALLRALPASDCVPELRSELLVHFERVCAAVMADFYARTNVRLAESGHALQSGGEGTLSQAAGKGIDADAAHASVGWRVRARERASAGLEASGRGRALQRWAARVIASTPPPDGRALQDGVFLAVLSLVQLDADAVPDPVASSLASQLQARILHGAGNLGIDVRTAMLSHEQATACALAGALAQGLIHAHAFDDEAALLFARLTLPLCRQLMTDPGLLDDAEHPVRALLDALAWALDANPAAAPEDAALRAVAVGAASDLLSDMHEPEQAFVKALDALRGHLAPLNARAALARRRLVQSIEGRERLVSARRESDLALAQIGAARHMLPEVQAFLAGPWHHALTQASLRVGMQSAEYAALMDTARALVALDRLAADAQGSELAQGVLRLEPRLRKVLLANGMNGGHADEAMAILVHALANPDHARDATLPDVGELLPDGEAQAGAQAPGCVDDWLTIGRGDAAWRAQIAWRRADSDCCLLIKRSGQRATRQELVDLGPLHADGALRLHRAHGPVEDLLVEWEAAASD
jgi:hypothetical protein